jgi:trans-aconitate methyltransferase
LTRDYHRFVFDASRREFVGEFEAMYQAENREHFDSWLQEDMRNLTRRVCLSLLADMNFARVLDVGCGKGAFTHQLKKANNSVVGIDISETALATARGRYPDVEFLRVDASSESLPGDPSRPFDLVVCLEALSYVEKWQDLIASMARRAEHALIALYLPDNPIGSIKSFGELREAFARHFRVDEEIHLINRRQLVLFGRSVGEDTDARL